MRIGLIAGNGRFPFLALDAARSLGHDVTVVAIEEETFPDIEQAARRGPKVAPVHWVSLWQLGQCISILRTAGVTQAVMAGQVRHNKIFTGVVRPDVAGVPDPMVHAVVRRLKTASTDALITAVADVMREHGIELLDSTVFLAPLLAREGRLTERAPSDEERRDFEFGVRIADAIAALDEEHGKETMETWCRWGVRLTSTAEVLAEIGS